MINWNKYLNLSSPRHNKTLLWFAAAFLFLAFFFKLTSELFEHNKLESIDKQILLFIADKIRTPALNSIAVDITALGSPVLISTFTIIGLVSLFVKKDRIGALFLALNVIGATLWMAFLKNYIGRERPNIIPHLIEISDRSYPSGHSLVSTATYFAIAFLVCRHIVSKKLIAVVLTSTATIVLFIAFSRLYLGVHYPSDVLSGLLFGISWVLALTAVFKAFSKSEIPLK
jgi:undecaprenyl-diphosphatase